MSYIQIESSGQFFNLYSQFPAFNLKRAALMEEDQFIDEQQLQQMQQINEQDLMKEIEQQQQNNDSSSQQEDPKPRKKRKLNKPKDNPQLSQQDSFDPNIHISKQILSYKMPNTMNGLKQKLGQVKYRTRMYKQMYIQEIIRNQTQPSFVGQNSIPICVDVTKFQFSKLISKQKELTGKQFDIIMMDPPWKLSSAQPSRGVAINYDSLSDQMISKIPVPSLQQNGFLFVWVINNKFSFTVDLMENKWGYRIIDQIPWVKATVNGKIAKGHGFYLQHAKQMCIVGVKGDPIFNKNACSNVIWSERRGQSQKPTQIYQYIQSLVPNGYYLQIFGRRNNLRNRWVTIGNQL